jgi:hypothetical protein
MDVFVLGIRAGGESKGSYSIEPRRTSWLPVFSYWRREQIHFPKLCLNNTKTIDNAHVMFIVTRHCQEPLDFAECLQFTNWQIRLRT